MIETTTDRSRVHTLRGRSSTETRSAVLDLIRASGEISRVDLARRSALTEATISKIVKDLLASGLIVQSGFAESTGGKRPALLRLNGGGVHALGISLDFNRSVVVLSGADGTELARRETVGIGFDEPPVALERVADAVDQLLLQAGIQRSTVIGLGLASGGRSGSPIEGADTDTTFVDIWESYPVEAELERRTGFAVIRENDADCSALGEFWAAQEPLKDFVSIYVSQGIGAGIVINGAIYRGSSGNAGEIGHTNVEPEGVACWCGSRGCLETVASPRAIARQALESPTLRAQLEVDERTPTAEVYERVVDLAAGGHEDARGILEHAAEQFSVAVCDLVNTLDLDLVVLAGFGFSSAASVFLDATRRRVEQTAFMRELHPITVRMAAAEHEAAARGAASVVLHRHLTPHRTASAG